MTLLPALMLQTFFWPQSYTDPHQTLPQCLSLSEIETLEFLNILVKNKLRYK